MLLVSMNVNAASDTLDNDKVKHAIAGLVVTALTYTFTDLSVGQSFAVGVGVGVLKEVHDMQPGGTGFDGFDLMATGVGAFGAGFVIEHIEHLGIGVKYKWEF